MFHAKYVTDDDGLLDRAMAPELSSENNRKKLFRGRLIKSKHRNHNDESIRERRRKISAGSDELRESDSKEQHALSPAPEIVLTNSQQKDQNRVHHAIMPLFASFEEVFGQDYINITNSSIASEKMQRFATQGHAAPPEDEWLIGGGNMHKYYSGLTINNTHTIPKIINKIYIEKSGLFPTKEERDRMGSLNDAHRSWHEKNDGYEMRYFNLNLSRKYLKETYHPIFLRAFDCIEAFSGKVDFLRMLVVYAEGGWYSDWKQECLKDNLLDVINENVDVYISWDHGNTDGIADKCVHNSFFGAVPQHPLIAQMIQMILSNVRNEVYGKTPIHPTGPCLFGAALMKYVEEHNPNQEMVRIRIDYFKNNQNKEGFVESEDGETYVRHKCKGCGETQHWSSGNNYNHLFKEGQYYCEDAASLFFDKNANKTESNGPWIFEAESSVFSHSIGSISVDQDGWLATPRDASGHMLYGPYTRLIPTGSYNATFRAKLVCSGCASAGRLQRLFFGLFGIRYEWNIVYFDVYDSIQNVDLGHLQVRYEDFLQEGLYQDFDVMFSVGLDRVSSLEFRAFYQGSGNVTIDKVTIRLR